MPLVSEQSVICRRFDQRIPLIVLILCLAGSMVCQGKGIRSEVSDFLQSHCLDCHDSDVQKGGLNLEALSDDLSNREIHDLWVKIHDRVDHGEMPPKKRKRPSSADVDSFLKSVSEPLIAFDAKRVREAGRAGARRMNRFEYENALRQGLSAPWLQVADMLTEDGTSHLFNKVGDRLDVSHLQMMKYLETADYSLRMVLQTVAHPTQTEKYYARTEPMLRNYLKYRFGQRSATRAAIPMVDFQAEPDVITGDQPLTVGDADPDKREREAMGFVSGTYAATTKYDFKRMELPVDGRYRIRLKAYSFLAGLNGASGGREHGLHSGSRSWWRPDRKVVKRSNRSEPVTLYALANSGDSRWLTSFDVGTEPGVVECEVILKKGEMIRPDATRLIRTRPGWKGNPNASTNGIPGVAFCWLEMEGPLHDQWPPAEFQTVFGGLDFKVEPGNKVVLLSQDEGTDAKRVLSRFMARMNRKGSVDDSQIVPLMKIYHKARELGEGFTDALIAAMGAGLCSTDFLFIETDPGRLGQADLASRLSFFLWNGSPDEVLLNTKDLTNPDVLRGQVERLLNDPRSERFQHAFLDYWLDLRDIHSNSPDAELYPDYYLDDWLTESSVLETRLFFKELIDENLPARNLIKADFTYANERLAKHYKFPAMEGTAFQKVNLPKGSVRGGLLTQSSVMRVTANGTTTSPVIRGAWAMERLMGVEIPPPPSGVEAITPDTRGATTIREQLDLHRAAASCAACHVKFDPAGFALESFDIAGGWRDRYRVTGNEGDRVEGFGKNGHLFEFRLAQTIDPSAKMPDGLSFTGIHGFRDILLKDERVIARNLVKRLVVFGTGAPVSFSDRKAVESILDEAKAEGYGVRSLIHAVVQSDLFRTK